MSDRIKKSFSALASFPINDLPTSLILEILLKLPLKTLSHSKCVCKSWHKLISTQEFTSSYLSNPPFLSFVLSVLKDDIDCLFLLEIGANGEAIRTPFILKQVPFPKSDVLEVNGSCNGLVCSVQSPKSYECSGPGHISIHIRFYQAQVVYVLNPLSGKYVTLPRLNCDSLYDIDKLYYGFGSCISGNCRKVVRIVHGYDQTIRFTATCEVFAVGEDSMWRLIEDCSRGVNVNGFVNWVGQDYRSCFVYAFDVGEERGYQMPLPLSVQAEFARKYELDVELTILDGGLCLTDFKSTLQVDIWTMKEYGVAESWTKDVIMREWIPFGLNFLGLIPITTLENGEILICAFKRGRLISFDPERKDCREVLVQGPKGAGFTYAYVPNFSLGSFS